MFEEAASLASSILKHLCTDNKDTEAGDEIELYDMLESSGMVLVQSLKELGRFLISQFSLYFCFWIDFLCCLQLEVCETS